MHGLQNQPENGEQLISTKVELADAESAEVRRQKLSRSCVPSTGHDIAATLCVITNRWGDKVRLT